MRRALSFLRQHLRLGEYLMLVAAGALAAANLATRGGADGLTVPATPFWILLYASLSIYLGLFLAVALRKLVALLRALAGRASDASFADLSDELELIRALARFVRDVLPLYATVLIYAMADGLIVLVQGSRTYDAALADLDVALLGGHASVWMQRFTSPLVTEVLSLCYFLHLVLPTLVLGFILLRSPRAEFVEASQAFVIMMTCGLVGYVLVPAVGPRYTLPYDVDLQGRLIGSLNEALINSTRLPRDVFPSLHVGLSAILLVYTWRSSRALALATLPFVVGNWIATVYLRYHYVVDLIAGWALVPLVYAAARRFARSPAERAAATPAATSGARDPAA